MHAKIKVRLPKDQKLKTEGDDSAKPGALIQTTYGRILFNTIFAKGMDFYNKPFKSGDLATAISDCYQLLGRRATIELLDDDEPDWVSAKRSSAVCRSRRTI